jgi:hypothetical protein
VDFTLRARLMAWEEALGGQLDLYYGGAQERSAMKMVVCMPVNSDLECPDRIDRPCSPVREGRDAR